MRQSAVTGEGLPLFKPYLCSNLKTLPLFKIRLQFAGEFPPLLYSVLQTLVPAGTADLRILEVFVHYIGVTLICNAWYKGDVFKNLYQKCIKSLSKHKKSVMQFHLKGRGGGGVMRMDTDSHGKNSTIPYLPLPFSTINTGRQRYIQGPMHIMLMRSPDEHN